MRYWKEGLLFGACALACAAPLLFGSAAVGLGVAGLGFLGLSERGMAAVIVAVGTGLFLWLKFKPAPLAVGAGCGCARTAECNTGDARDISDSVSNTQARPAKTRPNLINDRISPC